MGRVPWYSHWTPPIPLLNNLKFLLPNVKSIKGSWSDKASRTVQFCSSSYKGCPCNGCPLNHCIYHNLGNGHIQWVNNILVFIKPVPYGMHTKHISCFIWDVSFGIYWGNLAVLRENRSMVAFIQFTKLCVPLVIISLVPGSYKTTCDCFLVSCGSLSTQTCSSTMQHSKPKTQVPNSFLSPSISAEVSQDTDDTDLQNETTPWYYTLWFQSFVGFALTLY